MNNAQRLSILRTVIRYLGERRIKTYLVGGCVRDWLMARQTVDIDIAVAADAISVAQQMSITLGGTFVSLDEENRIARVVLAEPPLEENQKQWYIDLSTLAGDIDQDLARRDFTIDALAIESSPEAEDPFDQPIIDPFGGRQDIEKKLIKATGESVFQADPLRLLRAVRLAAELGFTISPGTENWIKDDCQLISRPAGERIREELLRILAVPGAGRFVRYLDKLGLLTTIIPELELTRGVEQPKEHYWDVLDHSIETVRAVDFFLHQGGWEYASFDVLETVQWTEKLVQYFSIEVAKGSTHAVLLRLAALLHDIAKPETKILAGEKVRFFGHDEQGAEKVTEILERIRFSHKEIKLVETMVRYHMRPTQLSQSGLASPRAIYRYFRDTGSVAIDILFLSLADHLAARGPDLLAEDWQWHADQTNCLLAISSKEETAPSLIKLIDGHDLINVFGLQPGPRIRTILESVREAQAAGEVTSRNEALSYVKNRLL
ncbi:MAG TPA: HD domain-containing protein [Dehalococcoidales bacterium]